MSANLPNLHFPQLLEIYVTDSSTRLPVDKIGLMLTVFASKKNNYHLALVTDKEGKAFVSLSEIQKSIETDKKLFPMDYASSLEDCLAEVEVKVCSTDEVKKAIEAMRLFEFAIEIDNNLMNGLENNRNIEYTPISRRILLDGSSNISVELRLRRVAE